MLVLFESWLPSDKLQSLWKGTRSAGFDGQPRHVFTDILILLRRLSACTVVRQKKRQCALILRWGINTPSAVPNVSLWLRPGSPDTSATSTFITSAFFERQALTLENIPGSDSHTWPDAQTEQLHGQTQTALQSACVNKVLPTQRPCICFIVAVLLCLIWWRVTQQIFFM